jgi:ethanolamine utilization protein EutN
MLFFWENKPMFFGKVIGQVIATKKESNLLSRRLLVVRQLDETLAATKKEFVCVDSVSAKVDDVVLTCGSSSARCTRMGKGTCSDNTIVGIVDRISSSKKDWFVNGQ